MVIRHVLTLVVIFCCVSTMWTIRLSISKCCKKGQLLNAGGTECLQKPGWIVSEAVEEVLHPPLDINNVYWVPVFFRNASFNVTYGEGFAGDWSSSAIDATDKAIQRLLNINATAQYFQLDPFKGRVNYISVEDQTFCFDAIEGPEQRVVFITSVYLRPLFKCCAKGERLDIKTQKCQQVPGKEVETILEEVLKPFEDLTNSYWLPHNMTSNIVKVLYRYRPSYRCNIQINADEVNSWKLLPSSSWYNVWAKSKNGIASTEGVTRYYCFDEVGDGAPYPRVLIALVTNVTKCCRKGEALSADETKCVPRLGAAKEDKDLDFEEVDIASNNSLTEVDWLPSQMIAVGHKFTIKYGDDWLQTWRRVVLRAENATQ